MQIARTGKMVEFKSISIGSPFWAHDRLWIRTSFESGTELRSTNVSRETQRSISACNFEIDENDHIVEAVGITA